MENLFTKYSVSEIIIFLIILAIAIKELVCFIDWARERIKQIYDKDYENNNSKKKLEQRIEDLEKFYDEKVIIDSKFNDINKTFKIINDKIGVLIQSDKEDIKSFITRQHHYFVYEVKWIDDYTLDCIEQRFSIYKQEHGNSFIEGLMNELRSLPKQPPKEYVERYNETAEYVKDAKNNKM